MNTTLSKFGYPGSCLCETSNWCVLLRPQQVTCASMVVVYKDDSATSLAHIDEPSIIEFVGICRQLEKIASENFGAEKFNYLALMMIDPHVHFHVLPRYSQPVVFHDFKFEDSEWPGPPDITKSICEDASILSQLRKRLLFDFAS